MRTHHAYYIEGALSQFDAYKAQLHPLWARSVERFGIEDARELTTLASLKNFADATYFLAAGSITSEAQQALLKFVEEPQEGTTIILLVPHGALMGTLLSRMLPYPSSAEDGPRYRGPSSAEAKKFLAGSGKDRSDMIAKLLKDDEGAKEKARELVNGLEAELYRKGVREGLEDIAKVRSYLGDRSPSLKMLLEHLALCLPKN